jgi:polyphosphate kinase
VQPTLATLMRAEETPHLSTNGSEQPPAQQRPARPRLNGSRGRGRAAAPAVVPRVPRAVSPDPVPRGAELDHPTLYFNRELGLLDFNWRVLHQALDNRTPLLERVRFLAITCNNIDEFFQKRVGGLKRQQAAGVQALSLDGRTSAEQLALIGEAALEMHRALADTWEHAPPAAAHSRPAWSYRTTPSCPTTRRRALDQHFREQIYPVLTPLAVDPGHPFPFISNLSLSLAVLMRHAARNTYHFARLKVPMQHGRWVAVPTRRTASTSCRWSR